MAASRNRLRNFVLTAAASMGGGLISSHARGAVTYYNPNGTTANWGVSSSPGTSWEGNVWSSTSSATAANEAWVAGTDAGLAATTPTAYTVYVGATESDAGFLESAAGETVTIASAASTTFGLTLVSGLQGFSVSGTNLIITAPMSGAGGPEQQSSGALSLYGSNSYTGGTETTGGQTMNYNNNHSFGTGSVDFTGTTGQGFVNGSGGSALTIANSITFGSVGASTNFVSGSVSGSAGTTFSGAVTLPASGSVNFQAGNATTDITSFSNVISGASGISVTGTGSIIFGHSNSYTGVTTLTAGTLKLTAANALAHTSSVAMNGGTLDASSTSEALIATLGLTASSTINVADNGVTQLSFADSHAVAWTSALTLNFTNWTLGTPSASLVRFGTTSNGLTSAQLAEIEFNGVAGTKGTAMLTGTGYLVPEPATLSLLMVAPLILGRRRKMQNSVV